MVSAFILASVLTAADIDVIGSPPQAPAVKAAAADCSSGNCSVSYASHGKRGILRGKLFSGERKIFKGRVFGRLRGRCG